MSRKNRPPVRCLKADVQSGAEIPRSGGDSEPSDAPGKELFIPPGPTVTLIPNAVLETQNNAGELFGFERTPAISTGTAEESARIAQAFSEKDDLTILTLTRRPVPDQGTDQWQQQALSTRLPEISRPRVIQRCPQSGSEALTRKPTGYLDSAPSGGTLDSRPALSPPIL